MQSNDIQAEVDNNYVAFKKLLPDLIGAHARKFALMRHGELVNVFDSANDAVVFAVEKYDDDLFSVQEITTKKEDMGYFSHAYNDDVV